MATNNIYRLMKHFHSSVQNVNSVSTTTKSGDAVVQTVCNFLVTQRKASMSFDFTKIGPAELLHALCWGVLVFLVSLSIFHLYSKYQDVQRLESANEVLRQDIRKLEARKERLLREIGE